MAFSPHRHRMMSPEMTTSFPSSTPSATTKLPIFAVGTVVRVQHNTSLFKIHSHAAWSDDDHQTPTYYNLESAVGMKMDGASGSGDG